MRFPIWLICFFTLRAVFCAQPGTIDTNFNPVLPPEVGTVNFLLEQPDGKILAGCSLQSSVANPKPLSRFAADGTADSAFRPPSIFGNIFCIALDSTGRILVGGDFTNVDGRSLSTLIGLNPNGTLDESFKTAISGSVKFVAIQPDGRAIIAGNFNTVDGIPRSAVARLQTDGSLDASYGSANATVRVPDSMVLEPEGTVLLISRSPGLVRLDLNGQPGPPFSLPSSFLGPFAGPFQIAEQLDGRILVLNDGGMQFLDSIYIPGMFRLNHDGANDFSFHTILNARVFGPIVLQPDGKILLASFGMVNGSAINGLGRLESDGSVDPNFQPPILERLPYATALTLLRDGDILAGGVRAIRRVHGGNPSPSAPLIRADPKNQTVTAGNNLSLAVTATGYPLSYQWRQNGVELNGATNASLTIFNVNNSSAGSYTALVTNELGAVETKPAVISIGLSNSLPNLIKNSSFETVTSSLDADIINCPNWILYYGSIFQYPKEAPLNYMGTQMPLEGTNYIGLDRRFFPILLGTMSPASISSQPYELTIALSLGDYSSSTQAVVRVSLVNRAKNLTELAEIIVTNRSDWQISTQRFVSDYSYNTVDIRIESGDFVYVDQVAVRPVLEVTPLLPSIPDQIVNAGTTLRLTNTISGGNLFSGPWRFSLNSGAPPTAQIDSNTGEFIWTPAVSDVGSIASITILATQLASGRTSAVTFNLRVVDLKLGLGDIALGPGQTGSIPVIVTLNSPLTAFRLTFSLLFPVDVVTNLSLAPIIGTGIQGATLAPVGPGLATVTLDFFYTTAITNLADIARIGFTTVSGAPSESRKFLIQNAFITNNSLPEYPHSLSTSVYPSPTIQPGGHLIIIGEAPLLSVEPVSGSQVQVRIFGRVGQAYALESSVSLIPSNWQVVQTVTFTNTIQLLPPLNSSEKMRFYRLRPN